VGYITNFIHNRKDPAPNCIKGYSRTTLVRGASPAMRSQLRTAWADGDIEVAGQLYLKTAKEILAKYKSAGSGVMTFTTNWRWFKNMKSDKIRAEPTLYRYLRVCIRHTLHFLQQLIH
jgi:hypothetical protein